MLDQNNSVGSGDYRDSPNEKTIRKFLKTQISINIVLNLNFVTFSGQKFQTKLTFL